MFLGIAFNISVLVRVHAINTLLPLICEQWVFRRQLASSWSRQVLKERREESTYKVTLYTFLSLTQIALSADISSQL